VANRMVAPRGDRLVLTPSDDMTARCGTSGREFAVLRGHTVLPAMHTVRPPNTTAGRGGAARGWGPTAFALRLRHPTSRFRRY
jgi:hypothetical protein